MGIARQEDALLVLAPPLMLLVHAFGRPRAGRITALHDAIPRFTPRDTTHALILFISSITGRAAMRLLFTILRRSALGLLMPKIIHGIWRSRLARRRYRPDD